jgi:Cu/Zn superoxide dismutase
MKITGKFEVQNNAYSMHTGTENAANIKPMAGSGQPWACGAKGESPEL